MAPKPTNKRESATWHSPSGCYPKAGRRKPASFSVGIRMHAHMRAYAHMIPLVWLWAGWETLSLWAICPKGESCSSCRCSGRDRGDRSAPPQQHYRVLLCHRPVVLCVGIRSTQAFSRGLMLPHQCAATATCPSAASCTSAKAHPHMGREAVWGDEEVCMYLLQSPKRFRGQISLQKHRMWTHGYGSCLLMCGVRWFLCWQ